MENEFILESLKAIENVDLSVYKQALDIALDNKKNTNIALSGSYGSGKSSIIESYKNSKGVKYRFLHISLAQYASDKDSVNDNESTKTHNSSNDVYERNLEGKILNQLLHQIKSSKIPQTIFKVKRKTKLSNLLFWSVSIPLMILLFMYVLGFDNWIKYFNSNFQNTTLNFLKFTTAPEIRLVSLGFVFVLLSIFIYKFTKLQIDKGFIQKISVKGNEIEVLKESKESYFDKYLNDVIYLFENASADVIVFEDIDRYNNSKIFEKLKEINTLVNQRNRRNWTHSRFIKHIVSTEAFCKLKKLKAYEKMEKRFKPKRKVAFLYLLRDDMFISKDRTKFFDMIIPVVPVIDASNSYEKFIEIFKKGNLLDLFDTNFLQKLSLYVDDMRLLKNIYNEFVIYHKEINTIDLNPNKLLAIITYKNIFPRDFHELQLSKGFVYSLFSSQKNELIDSKTQEYKDQLKQLVKDMESSEKDHLLQIDELNIIFLYRNGIYTVNDRLLNEFEDSQGFINDMKKDDSVIEVYSYNSSGCLSWERVNQETVFQEFENIPEYIGRKQNIINKEKASRERNLEMQNELKKKIEVIKSCKLSQIISQEDIEQFTEANVLGEEEKFNDIKRSDYFLLLSFLIKNGFLDESYSDYMTYFYPNSLTKNDRLFLRSITDEKSLDYTYELFNFEQIIRRMDMYDFSKQEVWNFNLLNFMLDKQPIYSDNLKRIIISLAKEINLDFIKTLFMSNKEKDESKRNEALLKLVFLNWNGFAESLLASNNHIVNNSILEVALATLDESHLMSQNTKEELTSYLNNSPIFLESLDTYSEKLIINICSLGVKVKSVNFDLIETNIADGIFCKNLYEINEENLTSILEHFYKIDDKESILHKNYTLLKQNGSPTLLEYVDQNIDTYMKEYLAFSDNKIVDEEEYAYELINNKKIDRANIEKYIGQLETKLAVISKVSNKDFWTMLIKGNKVEGSEQNLLEYYVHNDNQWTDELVQFVNNSKSRISVNRNNVFSTDDERINFFESTVKQYELDNNSYSRLVSSIKSSFQEDLLGSKSFPLTKVPDKKMSILIDNKIIEMNAGTLKDIRKNYPNKVKYFIKKNLDKYLDIIDDEESYDRDELLFMLDEEKSICYAKHIVGAISIIGKKYSNELIEFILKEKFDISDLTYLISKYSTFSSIQRTIESLAIAHLDIINEDDIRIKV